VGNRVVNVEQIELIEFRYLGHTRGESQVIRRKLEERIVGNGDLMIKNTAIAAGQPERLRIGDEMDFVPQGGQLNAELSGHHARTAVGGITGDADAHVAFFILWRECRYDHKMADRPFYGQIPKVVDSQVAQKMRK